MGLLHDLGKYSSAFQHYIRSHTGLNDFDRDDANEGKPKRGSVDHSTAGAQLLWQRLEQMEKASTLEKLMFQVMQLCIASHHGGLIDCLTADPSHPAVNKHRQRMQKIDEKSHLSEVVLSLEPEISQRIERLLQNSAFSQSFKSICKQIQTYTPNANLASFHYGLLTRYLFSCLIDADRLDSALFETPENSVFRVANQSVHWDPLVARLETHLSQFNADSHVNQLRAEISNHCKKASLKPKGSYTLTVPTGGGKTLASLRFALGHAQHHQMDRLFYIIPFTTIIDQNAKTIKDILDPEGLNHTILEHHSNVTEESQSWQAKLSSENWDLPIVLTTMVQFLETLFGGGTRSPRRMHNLANSVLIFDEVQSIPLNCIHLFNNALKFLVQKCGATVLLCTATQPQLHTVDEEYGALELSPEPELMPDAIGLFKELKRVEIINHLPHGEKSLAEIAKLAMDELQQQGNCLVVVNTKGHAQQLFQCAQQGLNEGVYHLSTGMCPVHRINILNEVRARLEAGLPTLCFSTQLIEAGVDVDFNAVIRFAAGLDSIAQAAGRCNRHGKQQGLGRVHVVMPEREPLDWLKEIKNGKQLSRRILEGEFQQYPAFFDHDPISLKALDSYYKYKVCHYKKDQREESPIMAYPLRPADVGRDDCLLNLLGQNARSYHDGEQNASLRDYSPLRQSFKKAAELFKAIDAPTHTALAPYNEEAKKLIEELCEWEEDFEHLASLQKRAQQYAVNLYPNRLKEMLQVGAITQVAKPFGTLNLIQAAYYSTDFGLNDEPCAEQELFCV
uniref:Putative DNA/RNA helicase. Metal dependent phosphohydrolase. Helicase Cas3, CRISPR-associated, core n=1 Tax=Magnetococcus massalia (strain MO-1) TaxID=451514 RepID=A0A1S7LGL9_MAGMO|nr:Putative DNA/RNA helicase. Metal dependent phosphohydrolase. Helicase Cas3, CRISPR-associated, core&\